MLRAIVFTIGICLACTSYAAEFTYNENVQVGADQGTDLLADGKTWLRTMTTPLDEARREPTYKVFTHIFDFDGKEPITKGAGGKYTHHRGMFIGWSDTLVGDVDYDTWHMSNCTQHHAEWLSLKPAADKATQVNRVEWRAPDGKPFIQEKRTITAHAGGKGIRVFDFQSVLESKAGPIKLRGDLQHAGMQVRMANEVVDHQDSTQYTMPEEAEGHDDDRVTGAWWMCCSPVVGGKRYWVLHMTPQTHPYGVPVYSIRGYARFGAFFEPDLAEGTPLELNFRILLSDHELDPAACERLYQEYVGAK